MNINKCENCFGATLRSLPLALEYEEKTDELFMVFLKICGEWSIYGTSQKQNE